LDRAPSAGRESSGRSVAARHLSAEQWGEQGASKYRGIAQHNGTFEYAAVKHAPDVVTRYQQTSLTQQPPKLG